VNKGSGELESNSLEINEKDSHLDDKNLIVNAPENREKNNISIVLSEGESSFSGSTTERAVKLHESPVVITQDETLSSEIVKLSGSPITNLLSSNTANTTKVDSTACVVE
jgi:type III secretory pathway lipoprotein EscJ